MTGSFNPSSPSYPGRAAILATLSGRLTEAECQVAYWLDQHTLWGDRQSGDALYRAEYTLGVMKTQMDILKHYPVEPSPEAVSFSASTPSSHS